MRKPDFPKKHGQKGWDKEEILEWVENLNIETARRLQPNEQKQEKIRLECKRLEVIIKKERETLKQAKLETDEKAKKLVDVAEITRYYTQLAQRFRARVEDWRMFNVAKYPPQADLIDALANDLIRELEDSIEEDS